MAVNEKIVTGRKFRKLIDETNKLWQRISFWTKASDVEFDNGMTAEIKMGAIDGITDSLASTSSRIAASAKSVNTLSNNLAQQPVWIKDSTGKITGYKTMAGADTVFPFSKYKYQGVNKIYVECYSRWGGGSKSAILEISISYNADGTVNSVSGTTSWISDGSNSASVSNYSVNQ